MALCTAATPFVPKKSKKDWSNPYVTTGAFQRYPLVMLIGPPMSASFDGVKPLVVVIHDSKGPSNAKACACKTTKFAIANKKPIFNPFLIKGEYLSISGIFGKM
jgi:hypothetical protein